MGGLSTIEQVAGMSKYIGLNPLKIGSTLGQEKSFELAPVLNPEDLDDLAAKVACDYREHRSAIVMMNGEDKAWVRTAFFEKGRRLYPGYHPALPDNFPDLVYGKLMESVSNG